VIHIDRVNADVEVLRSPAAGVAEPAGPTGLALDAVSMERLQRIVMDVLREHLRDLERRGLL
jgi:hypothetical protein